MHTMRATETYPHTHTQARGSDLRVHFKNTREVRDVRALLTAVLLVRTLESVFMRCACACLHTHAHTLTPQHMPNITQAAFSLRKMELTKAKKYLEEVMAHRRAIPFRRFSGNVGRTGQAKNEGAPAGQARWPVKSCEFLLNLMRNAESNAEVDGGVLQWGWFWWGQHTEQTPSGHGHTEHMSSRA